METLIPMTDFVLNDTIKSADPYTLYDKCLQYAKFLKQPLELWMFVPVGEDGEVLEEPKNIFSDYPNKKGSKLYQGSESVIEYLKAKERCLFEGLDSFEVNEIIDFHDTVECISKFKDIKLTPTALKQIGV